jgi:hypothetical protein
MLSNRYSICETVQCLRGQYSPRILEAAIIEESNHERKLRNGNLSTTFVIYALKIPTVNLTSFQMPNLACNVDAI